jgi:hypothetical protein
MTYVDAIANAGMSPAARGDACQRFTTEDTRND